MMDFTISNHINQLSGENTILILSSLLELLNSAIELDNYFSIIKSNLIKNFWQVTNQLQFMLSTNNCFRSSDNLLSNVNKSPSNIFRASASDENLVLGNLQENNLNKTELSRKKIGNIFIFKKGIYSPEERLQKILRYKIKINSYRNKIPVLRKYEGRSKIACNKTRNRGRFIKQACFKKTLFKIC